MSIPKETTRKSSSGAMLGILGVAAIVVALLVAFGLSGCSGSTTTNSKGEELINGHPVSEYNADIDHLSGILSRAKGLNSRLEAMGDPNAFTTQAQVDEYNNLVNQYNSAADEYNSAAKAFSSKYGSTIDGAGTRPTDPDNIDLPKKR